MLKSPFKWVTGNTFFAEINNRGYLFLESLLALSLATAISIFYLSLIMTMLLQVAEEKTKVELSRAIYDLARLEPTETWHRKTNSLNISGQYNENHILVLDTGTGYHLEINLPNTD